MDERTNLNLYDGRDINITLVILTNIFLNNFFYSKNFSWLYNEDVRLIFTTNERRNLNLYNRRNNFDKVIFSVLSKTRHYDEDVPLNLFVSLSRYIWTERRNCKGKLLF